MVAAVLLISAGIGLLISDASYPTTPRPAFVTPLVTPHPMPGPPR